MYRPYSPVADSRPFLDVQALIRNSAQDFVAAFNTGNYDHAAALFATDGALMVPHHEAGNGPKGVEQLLRKIGDAGWEDLRLETSRVECSGEIAMEVGRYSAALRQPDGSIRADRGKYVRVWRRLGAWLIIADCWNSSLAAPVAVTASAVNPGGSMMPKAS